MTTTFKCHDVEPEQGDYYLRDIERHNETEGDFLLESLNLNYGGVEAAALNLRDGWTPGFAKANALIKNPLIGAMLNAYNLHWEMVFAPDDIWLAIANGFARHINVNAEELRSQFVDWDGKKCIEVRRDSFVKGSPENDWPGAFAEFSDKIGALIGKKRDLIVADFTTTGPIEKAASEVVLLDAMQKYFDFSMRTMSGFSKVTVLGDVADWENIKQRVQNLAEFGLEWWTRHLEPVIDQFIAAAKGSHDVEFWKRAINRHGGSGHDGISGWVLAFFPYLRASRRDESVAFEQSEFLDWETIGRTSPDAAQFGPMISTAPFKWHYYAETFEMQFMGGLMAPVMDVVGKRVRTATGWAIREQGKDPVKPEWW